MPAKSDKLFQKRRTPTKAKFKRPPPTREPKRRILIVAEGEVTEPNYFEAYKTFAGLVNVDIDVCGKECASAPISVVKYAQKRAESEGHYSSGGYDEVYCVFDRDTHSSFDSALSKIFALNKSKKFPSKCIEAITSFPCFEIWILFHFIYTRQPFNGNANKSPADELIDYLKKNVSIFSSYEKNFTDAQLTQLFRNLNIAVKNAEQSIADARATGNMNPCTNIHVLLEKIKS